VNVTGYHLRGHANTLSDLDLQHSLGYDFAFKHHQQQQQDLFHTEQYSHNPSSSPIGSPSIPSRHRALTESYLMMQSHQHQHQQQHFLRQSMSPHAHLMQTTNSYGSHFPSSDSLHQLPDHDEQFHHQLSPSHSGLSSHQSPSNNQSLSEAIGTSDNNILGSWNSFDNERGHVERSVSFGGVGWAPSSLTSPSRRGFSDVGLTDISIPFNSSNHIPVGATTAAAAPSSREAWSSLLDLGMEFHLPPTDAALSSDSFHDLHSMQLNDYSESSTFQFEVLVAEPHDGADQSGSGDRGIQELRLQAREFIPQSHQQYQTHHSMALPPPPPQSPSQQWKTTTPSSTTASPLPSHFN
jgi:hypothetical protein